MYTRNVAIFNNLGMHRNLVIIFMWYFHSSISNSIQSPCSLVKVDRRFRGAYCSIIIHRSDNGGSTYFWNVGLLVHGAVSQKAVIFWACPIFYVKWHIDKVWPRKLPSTVTAVYFLCRITLSGFPWRSRCSGHRLTYFRTYCRNNNVVFDHDRRRHPGWGGRNFRPSWNSSMPKYWNDTVLKWGHALTGIRVIHCVLAGCSTNHKGLGERFFFA
jgi:hypothetical protein